MPDPARIRDAASVLLIRTASDGPSVLMGQRGAKAAFMPDKFVFPGGAVDSGDARVPLADPLPATCAARLGAKTTDCAPEALAAAAIRELWEEAGLRLGRPGTWAEPPPDWQSFAETGLIPSARGMRFVFRAITPPGRPRRFDARFLLIDAGHVHGDPDDFSRATDELRHLQWVPVRRARDLNLPFITEVVLAEVAALLSGHDIHAAGVPFFDNSGAQSAFSRLA